MTKEEIKKLAREYADCTVVSVPEKVVFNGWVCRDKDGLLNFFYNCDKPRKRDGDYFWSIIFGDYQMLPEDSFPSITWASEPRPARIEIAIVDDNSNCKKR